VRPNILLLVLDTARADALEPYGAPAGSTPTLADLARRGRALPRVYAPACWTMPSHASFLTGLLPRAAGLARAPGGKPMGCKPLLEAHADRLLPEVLRRAGYATAAVSTNVWIAPASGFETGFDQFVTAESGRQRALSSASLRGRVQWAVESVRGKVDDGAAAAERVLGRWLDERDDRPFFWFVNLVECHSPYLPPRPYNDLGVIQRLRAADEARTHLTLRAIWRTCLGEFDIPPDALERMRHLYARSVTYMDDWLARLLDAFEARGVLDDTLVLVISDHGENFGESGLMAHAFSLDDRLIHVPFIAAGPGVPEGEVRSLTELPRIVAEAAGLDGHPWRRDDLPAGAAVAQFDPPGMGGDERWRGVLAGWGLGDEAWGPLTTPLTCATDGERKLMMRGRTEELYDLATDPLELAPATAAADDPRLGPLREALAHPALRAAAPAGPEAVAEPVEQASDEELEKLEERMRLLGYM
jgi:arylsulfatase A-like enzyme